MAQAQRRRFLFSACALAASPLLRAQDGKTFRIGSAHISSASTTRPYDEAFLAGLRELGFERGKNLIYDVRNCDNDPMRLPAAVDELIALKPNLLFGVEQVARVMRNKTGTIPIVLTFSIDPVAAGLADSLARPGGNVTGIAAQSEATAGKCVELLAEIVSPLNTIAVLLHPGVPASANIARHVRAVLESRHAAMVVYWAKDKATVEEAFTHMARHRPDALVQASGGGLFGLRRLIADNALRLRLPIAGGVAPLVEAGYLCSYGLNLPGAFRQAASHAARILRGARAGELPIEQAQLFELAVNLKTAKAIGLTIPQSILLRADRVIQ
jgi:putative ABC transport system substrate-binding protein